MVGLDLLATDHLLINIYSMEKETKYCECCDKDLTEEEACFEDGSYMRQGGEGWEAWICINCTDSGRAENEGWE